MQGVANSWTEIVDSYVLFISVVLLGIDTDNVIREDTKRWNNKSCQCKKKVL